MDNDRNIGWIRLGGNFFNSVPGNRIIEFFSNKFQKIFSEKLLKH